MTFERSSLIAAASFAKPLFQHRTVCVVCSDSAAGNVAAAYLREHGAKSVNVCAAAALAGLTPGSVEIFFCFGDDELSNDAWTALLRARSEAGVVVVQQSGDASRAAQGLSRRFGSVERAELVRGESSWVGPPGAVTAAVHVDEAAAHGSVFVCAERPQRLALGSVCMSSGGALVARRVANPAPTSVEQSLSGDIAASLDEDRLREVEGRLAQTMEDLVQAQLVAAQALAERDTLKRKLESGGGSGKTATSSESDAALIEALHQELTAIEALVKRLPRS